MASPASMFNFPKRWHFRHKNQPETLSSPHQESPILSKLCGCFKISLFRSLLKLSSYPQPFPSVSAKTFQSDTFGRKLRHHVTTTGFFFLQFFPPSVVEIWKVKFFLLWRRCVLGGGFFLLFCCRCVGGCLAKVWKLFLHLLFLGTMSMTIIWGGVVTNGLN